MNDRFDKFTERARNTLSLAQEEAQKRNHNYIGTEHLLLALTHQPDSPAARILTDLGASLDTVRVRVDATIGRGDRIVLGEIGMTPRAKKVIELAVDEARRFNHHYVGTEHLLLGLIREGEGIAAGVLESLGVNLERARGAAVGTLAHPQQPQPSQSRGILGRFTYNNAPATPTPVEQTTPTLALAGLTPESQYVLRLAHIEAEHARQLHLGDEHLLLGIVLEGRSPAARALDKRGATIVALRDALTTSTIPAPPEPGLTPLAQIILGIAQSLARAAGATMLTPEHLLLALLRSPEGAALAALRTLGIDSATLVDDLAANSGEDAPPGE